MRHSDQTNTESLQHCQRDRGYRAHEDQSAQPCQKNGNRSRDTHWTAAGKDAAAFVDPWRGC